MKETVENALVSAKRILEQEFIDYPYAISSGLCGKAAAYWKVCDYIFQSIDANVEQSTCKKWLTDLVVKYKMPEEDISYADLMIDVAYRHTEYLRTKK